MSEKYGGEPWREPSWYPENPLRKKRFEAFNQNLGGFGHHFAEVEPYWDEGRDATLNTVRPLLELVCVLLGDRLLKGEANNKESKLCGELSKMLSEEKVYKEG